MLSLHTVCSLRSGQAWVLSSFTMLSEDTLAGVEGLSGGGTWWGFCKPEMWCNHLKTSPAKEDRGPGTLPMVDTPKVSESGPAVTSALECEHNCHLLLINRRWQKKWDVNPVRWLHLSKLERSKLPCCDRATLPDNAGVPPGAENQAWPTAHKKDGDFSIHQGASLVVQVVKNLPAMQEIWVQSLGLGRSPGEGNGNPLQLFSPGESHGHGVAESHDWVNNIFFQSTAKRRWEWSLGAVGCKE